MKMKHTIFIMSLLASTTAVIHASNDTQPPTHINSAKKCALKKKHFLKRIATIQHKHLKLQHD